MDKVKGTLLGLLVLIIIIVVPSTFFSEVLTWIINAIKWVVLIDNAETGLPFIAELIIKGIAEAIIIVFAIYLGIDEKNPLVSIIVIILGFVLFMIFYALCKYYVWILVIMGLLFLGFVIYIIISNKKKKKIKEGEAQND